MKGLVECFSELGKNPIEVTPKYNQDDKLLEEIAIYEDGMQINTIYDENGKIKKEIITQTDKTKSVIIYDEDGNRTESINRFPNGERTNLKYRNGKLVEGVIISPDGTVAKIIYDKNEKAVQEITTSLDKTVTNTIYDKNEKVVQEITTHPDGMKIDKKYENGRLVQKITTHPEGVQEKEIIGTKPSQEKVSDHLPISRGRIEHPRLSSELKELFSAKQEKYQGLFYLTNAFKNNSYTNITNPGFHAMVNFLNTQKKDKNIVFEAFDNIDDITLDPNNSQLRIISTSIPEHQFLLIIQSGKVQILDNGGLGEQRFIKIQEKLQKEGAITVEKTNLKIDRGMKIKGRGDCVLCAAAFMFKIFRMVEGLSYNDLVNLEFTTSKTPLDPKISFETIIQKFTDHTLNIHKVMANYALFYANKNQEYVNIDKEALNVYADDNNKLLMGCSVLLQLPEQLKKQSSNQEKIPSPFRLAYLGVDSIRC